MDTLVSYGSIPAATVDETQAKREAHDAKVLVGSGSSSSLDETFHSIVSLHITSAAASIPSEVVNMTKNLIGGGVLSLPGGVARFANNSFAAVSVVEWIVVLGTVFGYFCLL